MGSASFYLFWKITEVYLLLTPYPNNNEQRSLYWLRQRAGHLSIIFIHTAFWSGQFYIPAEVRVFPLFWCRIILCIKRNDIRLQYWKNFLQTTQATDYLYDLCNFSVLYGLFFKVFGLSFFSLEWLQSFYSTFGSKYSTTNISTIPQWQNLGNWYLHQYTNADTFPVVMGSFWYLKVYYILTVLGVLILRFFPKHINWFIGLCIGLTLLFNIFRNIIQQDKSAT